MKNGKEKYFIITVVLLLVLCFAYIKYVRPDLESSITITNSGTSNTPIESIDLPKTIHIHVAGEVANPGLYTFSDLMRVAYVIEAAGGATELADLDKINLAALVGDGQKIMVPKKGDSSATEKSINLNYATYEELCTLPGIGDVKARAIIEYRERVGMFNSIDEIKKVSGIGEATFNAIKDLITV